MVAVISMEELASEIGRLEGREATWAACERLAWLYVIRHHMREREDSDRLIEELEERLDKLRESSPDEYEEAVARLRRLVD